MSRTLYIECQVKPLRRLQNFAWMFEVHLEFFFVAAMLLEKVRSRTSIDKDFIRSHADQIGWKVPGKKIILIHAGETRRLDIYRKNISRSLCRYELGVTSTVKWHAEYVENKIYETEATNYKLKSVTIRRRGGTGSRIADLVQSTHAVRGYPSTAICQVWCGRRHRAV